MYFRFSTHFEGLILYNSDYLAVMIVCDRFVFGQEEYTHTIHLSDLKTVLFQFRLEILSLRLILCDFILMNSMYIIRFMH
jgi:hypothetical protein